MLAAKNSQISQTGQNGFVSKRPMVARALQANQPENAHLDAFLTASHRRKYLAKSTLIYAGDKSDSIYYVLKGAVTVLVEDESGCEIIVAYLNKGDFFGKMPLCVEDTPRLAWVKAKTECELTRLPDAMTHPDGMQVKITRQEIGRIVGCSREMVGRVLKTLVEQGLVSVKGKTMVVYGTR